MIRFSSRHPRDMSGFQDPAESTTCTKKQQDEPEHGPSCCAFMLVRMVTLTAPCHPCRAPAQLTSDIARAMMASTLRPNSR
jgi:hypothetical protein